MQNQQYMTIKFITIMLSKCILSIYYVIQTMNDGTTNCNIFPKTKHILKNNIASNVIQTMNAGTTNCNIFPNTKHILMTNIASKA